MRRILIMLSFSLQFGAVVVCAVLIPLAAGFWLDGHLHSYPLFMLIFSLAGLALGTVAVYRLAQRVHIRD
jgi:F0F1-type ATP synthase assembly protein I